MDFEKVFMQRGERRELRRERYAGYFEFVVQEHVPNNFVLVNPAWLDGHIFPRGCGIQAMIQNALAGAIFVYAVLAGVLLKECVFLAPLRVPLWEQFGAWIVGFFLGVDPQLCSPVSICCFGRSP